MKYIIRLLILTVFIGCNTTETILFELKDLDDVLSIAESTSIAKLPEEQLSKYLLAYEEIDFLVKDTTSEDYGKLRYHENDTIVFKHLGKIYSNDTFSVHVILREKKSQIYKFFLRTINKWNYVIDNYEIASWVPHRNRHCYGSINNKLEVSLICDEDKEYSYIDSKGYFRNSKIGKASKNKIIDYYEYLSSDLGLEPIENANYESVRVIFYSGFQYGKVIEFSNREAKYMVKQICYSKIEDSEPCQEFKARMSFKDWQNLKRILIEFDFYTEEQVRNNEDVLDGFIYIVEGRTTNDTSKELQYRFLSRGSPAFDKIGSLCENLIKYAENKQAIH